MNHSNSDDNKQNIHKEMFHEPGEGEQKKKEQDQGSGQDDTNDDQCSSKFDPPLVNDTTMAMQLCIAVCIYGYYTRYQLQM